MKKQWSINFANSVPAQERSRLAGELEERLKAQLENYNNNCELKFSEGALPFTLRDIVNVIPAAKICLVTLDSRYDVPLTPYSASSVQMVQTRGGSVRR